MCQTVIFRTLGTLMHEMQSGPERKMSCVIRVGDCTAEVWRAVRMLSHFVKRDCNVGESDRRLHLVLAFENVQGQECGHQYVENDFLWGRDSRLFTFQGRRIRA